MAENPLSEMSRKLAIDRAKLDQFYQAARGLLERQDFARAGDAFFFLSRIEPQIALFHLCQARADRFASRPKEASEAYEMAAVLADEEKHWVEEALSYLREIGEKQRADDLKELIQRIDES